MGYHLLIAFTVGAGAGVGIASLPLKLASGFGAHLVASRNWAVDIQRPPQGASGTAAPASRPRPTRYFPMPRQT